MDKSSLDTRDPKGLSNCTKSQPTNRLLHFDVARKAMSPPTGDNWKTRLASPRLGHDNNFSSPSGLAAVPLMNP